MLGLFKGKNKGNLLHSTCNGKVVPITEVPDSTFADKILGDGFAVIPSEGKVYAPADNVLQQIQKHKTSGLVGFLQWKTLCSNYCRSCFYSCICCFIIRMAITFRCTCCSWKRYCWSGCCRSRYLCIPQPTADPYRITSRTEQCILV